MRLLPDNDWDHLVAFVYVIFIVVEVHHVAIIDILWSCLCFGLFLLWCLLLAWSRWLFGILAFLISLGSFAGPFRFRTSLLVFVFSIWSLVGILHHLAHFSFFLLLIGLTQFLIWHIELLLLLLFGLLSFIVFSNHLLFPWCPLVVWMLHDLSDLNVFLLAQCQAWRVTTIATIIFQIIFNRIHYFPFDIFQLFKHLWLFELLVKKNIKIIIYS